MSVVSARSRLLSPFRQPGAAALAGWVALLCLPPAVGAAPRGFQGARPIVLADYLPRASSVEGYSEQWSFSHELTGGGALSVQVVVSNAGLGDGKGGLKVDLRLPDGTRRRVRERCTVRGRVHEGRAELTCAGLTVASSLDGYVATLEGDGLRLKAGVRCTTPAWRPGDGRVSYDDDGRQVYELLVPVPRGELSGTLAVGEQPQRALRGVAFADHSRSTLGPHLVAKRWLRFKRLTPALSVLFATWQAPSGERFAYLLATDAKGRQLASAAPVVQEGALQPAPNRAAYALPHDLRITAEQGGGRVEVRVAGAQLARTKDMLGSLNALERLVARRFSDPFGYSLRGQLEIRWEQGGEVLHQVRAEDGFLVEHINP